MSTVTYFAHASGIGWDEELAFVLLPIRVIAFLALTAKPARKAKKVVAPEDNEFSEALDGWSDRAGQ